MTGKGKIQKRVFVAVFSTFLVLQVHSYWQFRYMLSDYFGAGQRTSESREYPAYLLAEPFFYVFEVAAVRIYHQRNLWAGDYLEPDLRWTDMSSDQVQKHVARSVYRSGNSEGVGDVRFGAFQFLSPCSMYPISNKCTQRYVLFGNHLCSFSADINISFDEFVCRQFFQHQGVVYTEDFWQVDSRGFVKSPLTKMPAGQHDQVDQASGRLKY